MRCAVVTGVQTYALPIFILRQHERIDWQRLLDAMELHWEVLLIHLLNFRFIYPTERHCIPLWLFEELLGRLQTRAELPVPNLRVCRGRLLSPRDYQIGRAQV